MNEEKENYKYLLEHLFTNICEVLQERGYNPCNKDGEFSEKEFYKTVENISEDVLSEKPVNIWNYIKNYKLD